MPATTAYGTLLTEKVQHELALQRSTDTSKYTRAASIDTSRWMSLLPDTALLSSLTIPGTHDSAAYASPWPFVATQSLPIPDQLSAGVRYLDLRCGIRHDVVEMVHGRSLLGLSLGSLLASLYGWLDAHPSEALVVQIKQDRGPEASLLTFAEATLALLLSHAPRWRFDRSNPALGHCRGRIQLFRRFEGPGWAGISVVDGWVDNPASPFTLHTAEGFNITVQDHYQPAKPAPPSEFIAAKESAVLDMLGRASEDREGSDWYINFCSAFQINHRYLTTPHDIAVGGYWFNTYTEGINPRLRAWFSVRKRRRTKIRYGVVLLDFPEQPSLSIVRDLIRTNLRPDTAKRRVSSMAVWCLPALLALIFIAGVLLRSIHGPARHASALH